jgi:hypothetical protein
MSTFFFLYFNYINLNNTKKIAAYVTIPINDTPRQPNTQQINSTDMFLVFLYLLFEIDIFKLIKNVVYTVYYSI